MKSALLDTHALLWAVSDPDLLGARARSIIEQERYRLFFSVASLWEIAIKMSIKKLVLKVTYAELLEESTQALGVTIVPIEPAHLDGIISLAFHHRDPFDRLLVATAKALDCPVISRDKHFDPYRVDRIWT